MRSISNGTLDGIERILTWVAAQPPGGGVADMDRRRKALKLLKIIKKVKDGK